MKLNFYLFNTTAKSFNDLMKFSWSEKESKFIDVTNKDSKLEFEYKIFLEKNKSKPPKRINYIKDYADNDQISDLNNVVNSAVILIKVIFNWENRFFAISNGFGFNAINRELIEENFWLIVALNAIDPEEIKFIDAKNVAEKTKQVRASVNLPANVFEFWIDFESELVRIVSWQAKDLLFSSKVVWADNLTLNTSILFSDLWKKCIELLELYDKEIYKENFGFINNIKPIKSKKIINQLDQKLFINLNSKNLDNIHVAYPDQIEYERCEYFKISWIDNDQELPDITKDTIEWICKWLDKIEKIKDKIKITWFEWSDNKPVIWSETLYWFLVFETDLDNKKYILSNKKWFEVDSDYVKKINEDIKSYVKESEINMPNRNKVSKDLFGKLGKYNEWEYNLKVKNSDSDYVYFDKQNFQIKKTSSKIEICDLYHIPSNNLICVKQLKWSSTLSHLFAQASVSAYLMNTESTYRTKFINTIKIVKHDFKEPPKYTYTYAIWSTKQISILDQLPIFSKINLLKHAKQIKAYWYDVEILKINMI